MEWKFLTDELYREYVFPGGDIVHITEPVQLNVSESGGHRVLDRAGVSHYIPGKWVHLLWKVKPGKTPFAF